MSTDRNNETEDLVRREIKEIQARCVQAWQAIENTPLDVSNLSMEDIQTKAICYLEGLRTEINNSETPITTDVNLLTSQFLIELQVKTAQVEELVAFTRGTTQDLGAEIKRLKALIKTAKEARSKPKKNKRELNPQHLKKAKESFQIMKSELHELMQAMFPNDHEVVIDILGRLMTEQLDESSDGYIPITSEIYHVIEILIDMKIVTPNPYNNLQVKLAY